MNPHVLLPLAHGLPSAASPAFFDIVRCPTNQDEGTPMLFSL